MSNYRVLILGASYGSLFSTKLAIAGHAACMVCLPEEESLINQHGTLVRLPVKGLDKPVELKSQELSGSVTATSTEKAIPEDYDLIVLAMQEPQYASPQVSQLLKRTALSKKPCMSIMNMPPLPFLARLPNLDVSSLRSCYTDPSVWDDFDPDLMTLASPDPQAFRPPEEQLNVLQVALPTNFKVSRFAGEQHTAMLKQIQKDIEDAQYEVNGENHPLPVKLKVHDSVYVPLAKWLMLITGNYRCVTADGPRSIRDAVHSQIEVSEEIYQWVGELCESIGASTTDLVPFTKYANAALSLQNPSSAARALAAGAKNIERLDKVVQQIAKSKGLSLKELDATVALVDQSLYRNRNTQ